jgi:hypothetical protein
MPIVINNLSVSMIDTDAELYAIWPRVRDGINSIEKRCKGVWYRPEDAYHEIKNKQSTLLIGRDAQTGEYQGFAIINECQFPDGKGMHIRSMHHSGNDKGFVDDFFDALEVMAKLCDVVRISYSSSRKGWEKRTRHKEYVKVASVHYFERVLS